MPAVPPTAALRTRLSSHIAMGNFEALRDHLAALRTAEFRAAGVVLAEANFWSPLTDEAFWAAFRTLCRADSRAFLGTLLKAATGRRKRTGLQFDGADFCTFCREEATDIDRRKMLEAFLPLAVEPAEAESLLEMLWQRADGEKCAWHNCFVPQRPRLTSCCSKRFGILTTTNSIAPRRTGTDAPRRQASI